MVLVGYAITMARETLLHNLLFVVTRNHGRSAAPVNVLTRELLERLAFSLGDQKSGEATAKHKKSEDLHYMLEPGGVGGTSRRATVDEGSEDTLGNDGTNLSGSSRETVRGGTVTGREAFPRHHEGGGVGTEVEEELS